MAGLFLVRSDDAAFATHAVAGARAQFARTGLTDVQEHLLPGWRLLHAPFMFGGPDTFLKDGDDLVAVAGTLIVDGRMGREALTALLAMDPAGGIDWTRIGGEFVAVVHKNGRSVVFTDFFAAFRLYHDADFRLLSTSFLSAVEALPKVSFDPQGVYEFAFNVVAIGDDTVLSELKTLGPDRALLLDRDGARPVPLDKTLAETPVKMPMEERIALHRTAVARVVEAGVSTFGNRVNAPLSGGLDSRLVLAMLRAAGCTPNLYVYGGPTDEDVVIAKAIADAMGFDVAAIDKHGASSNVTPDTFPSIVEAIFHRYDALPNFGGLFNTDADLAAMNRRHAGGALAISGGCGEVFRNFFFLPDRPIRASSVARAFFARFVASDATDQFDPRAFLRGIEDKILKSLGAPGERGKLPRGLIEQTYPRIRCRSLFGKEISDEARHGAYLMPFLDHQVVAASQTLPQHLKNAGAFEAALINAVDPELARQPSAYGHHFAEPPSRDHRRSEWLTRIRPAWVRQHSYGLQRRLKGAMGDEHGGLMSPDYLGRVVDLDYPAMRRFFRVDAIADGGIMRRVACLEYLAGYLGGRLVA